MQGPSKKKRTVFYSELSSDHFQNVTKHFRLWQTTNVNKKISYGKLTQIQSSQTIEATAERLSLSEPATRPIGTVGKFGSGYTLPQLRGNRMEEAIDGENEEEWQKLGDRRG